MQLMKIVLINGSAIPLYEQIKDGIKENIIRGEISAGEQLPSVRTLSKELKVSILTVKKAYDELEAEGFVESRQGLGTFAATDSATLRNEEKQKKLEELLQESVSLAKELALSENDLKDLFELLWEGE